MEILDAVVELALLEQRVQFAVDGRRARERVVVHRAADEVRHIEHFLGKRGQLRAGAVRKSHAARTQQRAHTHKPGCPRG